MKIRIEGCTAEELAEYSPYLSLGKVYEVISDEGDLICLEDDRGQVLVERLPKPNHIPEGAKWVEVME